MSFVKLKLQSAIATQLPQVVELDQLTLGGLWTLEGYRRELESPNSELLVLSVVDPSTTDPEQIIGCGCFWAILEEAHITLLAIHPEYQGRGLGKLLLYALLKNAVKRKLERATLEVREANQVALSVYKKFGFKTAGRRKGYYQQTGEDALVLWRGDLHYPSFKQELESWQQQIENQLLEQGLSLTVVEESLIGQIS
ncbi:ribosomal protein S18-alanine N-acetyltransferase [Gloeothece verrucosa]|uniref:Ribosomal-protein-alanine acetyltransferase n=1 Tax=Gloeothece verrucosa (strain PCC 7822) TaxID=497965 RepID=E0UGX8_GLOV7|nr:ribosomal protein S18-alanine N-acetyltransferase [Gloeothece verrucosa]ADN14459.1 ribosomal-protein-alanine acetyltransferase [Gloeothece verrucosa PCC 7822]